MSAQENRQIKLLEPLGGLISFLSTLSGKKRWESVDEDGISAYVNELARIKLSSYDMMALKQYLYEVGDDDDPYFEVELSDGRFLEFELKYDTGEVVVYEKIKCPES